MSVPRRRLASVAVIGATGCSAALWMLFAKYFVPPLIANAYNRESVPFFNALISGQNIHPLSDYIISWDAISLRVLMAVLACGIGAIVVMQPAMQEIVWGQERERRGSADISWPRLSSIYTLLAVIAIGSAVSILRGADYWPFSNYPMYSYPAQGNQLQEYRLYGVTQQGREFPFTEYAYTQPFDNARVSLAFENLRKHGGSEEIQAGLADFLHRYEAARALQQHSGPPLQGIKLYKVTWTLDPLARNVDQPDTKVLVSEARVDEDALER